MNRKKKGFVDLVISGPDMSGTSTQIQDVIDFFQNKNSVVRDMKGTEIDALFHAEIFTCYNKNRLNLKKFLNDTSIDEMDKNLFLRRTYNLLSGLGYPNDLMVASMVKTSKTTFVDPNSADVWIFEEPTKRGAGQANRVIEQNRASFGSKMHAEAAALSHQNYRTDEFLRFRKVLREIGKVIVRSRSEESAAYQIDDSEIIPNGINTRVYLSLPGHKYAFSAPPTHIFLVCGPENWKEEKYIKLKKERGQGRDLDDHEMNVSYQILVNKRYASKWIDDLYDTGCKLYNSTPPEIVRFDIYDSKEEIKTQMAEKLETIISK